MNTVLIDRATVLTMDAQTGTEPVTRSIRIRVGQITEVGTELTPQPGETVLAGQDRLVVPGYVNAHTHSWEALFRARLDNLPLEHWMLLSYPVLGLAPLSPDLIRLRSALVAIESLRNGVTTLVDDVLEIPGQTEEQLALLIGVRPEDMPKLRAGAKVTAELALRVSALQGDKSYIGAWFDQAENAAA